jgi:hypothetical protein
MIEKILSVIKCALMKRVFKTRYFTRWMRKTALTDPVLCEAIYEMIAGLIDADLGGGVLKKRVALPGGGKSAGTRTLVATNKDDRWFFVFGFEKNVRANVTAKELEALQTLAADLLKLSTTDLNRQVERQTLVEICHE